MYRYESLVAEGIRTREMYGMLCKEKQEGRWIVVSVFPPFSDNREETRRLAELYTAQQRPLEQVVEEIESLRKEFMR